MFSKLRYAIRKKVMGVAGREPIWNLKSDGTLYITWENPADKDSRAFDLEHSRQQVFVEGYANPVRITVDDVEYSDPEKDAEPDVSLIPSGRYEQFMKQSIISDALAGGSMANQKMFYMSAATLAMVVIGVVIILSVVT